MAELILFAQNSGAAPDQYQKGDIVDIFDDGVYSGKAVKAPDFFIVKLAGTAAEHEDYKQLVSHMDGEDKVIDHKRKYNVDYISVLGQERVDEIINSEEWIVDEIQAGDITEKS